MKKHKPQYTDDGLEIDAVPEFKGPSMLRDYSRRGKKVGYGCIIGGGGKKIRDLNHRIAFYIRQHWIDLERAAIEAARRAEREAKQAAKAAARKAEREAIKAAKAAARKAEQEVLKAAKKK